MQQHWLRRLFFRYKEAEVVYSIQHKKAADEKLPQVVAEFEEAPPPDGGFGDPDRGEDVLKPE